MRLALRLVVVLVLLAGALVLALPWLAPPLIRWQLQAAGIEEVEFGGVQIGTTGAAIEAVRLGRDQKLGRLRLAYGLGGLSRGRIDLVEVEDLELRLRLTGNGIEIPGLPSGTGGAGGWAPPLRPERLLLRSAELTIEGPFGTARTEGDLDLQVGATKTAITLDQGRLRLEMPAGVVTGTLEGAGTIDPVANDPLASLQATGRVEVEGAGLAHGQVSEDAALGAEIALVADGRTLTLTTARSALEAASITAGSPLAILAGREAGTGAPFELRLGRENQPFQAVLDLRADGAVVVLEGSARLESGARAADLALDATLELDADWTPERIARAEARLGVTGLEVDGVQLKRLALALEAGGPVATLSGAAMIELQAGGGTAGGAGFEQLALELPVRFSRQAQSLDLTSGGAGRIELTGLRMPEQVSSGAARLSVEQRVSPIAIVGFGEAGADWQLDLPLRLEALQIEPAAAAALPAFAAERGRLQLVANGRGAELGQATLALEDTAIRVPGAGLALEGVAARLPFDRQGLIPGRPIRIGVEALRDTGPLKRFAPLEAEVRLTPQADAIMFEGALEATGTPARLAVRGEHRPASGDGRATLELAPLTFAPDGLQPAALVPAAAAWLEDVGGRVALDGGLTWTEDGLVSALEVLLEDIALTSGPARVEGLNGVVALDELLPLSTPPRQQLAIGLFDVGLRFTEGTTTFQLKPGGPLAVHSLRFVWAGGQLRADPFTIGSEDGVLSTTLHARGLDLDAIFGEVNLPGLAGEGVIDGRLPLRIQGAEATLEKGELEARRPGWLRYHPDAAPGAFAAGGDSMALLLQALENFRYDELRITLDGRTDAAMDIGLHLKGANPDLYDGHPVEFNLNLEGELANILKRGLRSYQIPDRIRQRIERSGER